MRSLIFACTISFSCILPVTNAAEYDDALQRAVLLCEQINPRESQTGLLFNPEGYRSYYLQSQCFQRGAQEFRALNLCDRVRRRLALFSSSWGYSRNNCRELVNEKIDKDRNEVSQLRQSYLAGPVRLVSVTLERNGNGRDFDFIPRFADGFATGYTLEYWLHDAAGNRHLILAHGNSLVGAQDNLRIFLRRDQLVTRYPGWESDRSYELEVTMGLSIGYRKIDGWLREDLLDETFPAQERLQSLRVGVEF